MRWYFDIYVKRRHKEAKTDYVRLLGLYERIEHSHKYAFIYEKGQKFLNCEIRFIFTKFDKQPFMAHKWLFILDPCPIGSMIYLNFGVDQDKTSIRLYPNPCH